MTAIRTRTAATPAAVPLTLDDRLALTGLAMDDRLDQSTADMAIRTAHIDTDYPPILPTPAPGRPLADLLTRAARRIATAGWSRHIAVDSTGGICPLYAIRLEAGSEREEGEARTALLRAIQAEQPNVVSIPQWNSQQTGGAAAIRMLQQAAVLAR